MRRSTKSRPKRERGKPDPCRFAEQHLYAIVAEEFPHADWRHGDRMHRKKIPAPIERRKKAHAQAAVRECIEHAMRCGTAEEIEPGRRRCPNRPLSTKKHREPAAPQGGKQQGVRQSSMSAKIAVPDTYVETQQSRSGATEQNRPSPNTCLSIAQLGTARPMSNATMAWENAEAMMRPSQRLPRTLLTMFKTKLAPSFVHQDGRGIGQVKAAAPFHHREAKAPVIGKAPQ
jgi:hypothetical protein